MNSFVPIDPALVDVVIPPSGYIDDGGDTRDVLAAVCGAATRDFPAGLWVEPKEWAEYGRKNDEFKTWPMNYVDRYTNQDPTDECTCHSLSRNFEGARNRGRGIIFPEGPKKNFRYEQSKLGSVWVAPLSVYNEANPRQRGGANVRQVLEIAFRRGFLPDKIQPTDYRFKHSINGTCGGGNNNQSTGRWVSVADMPEGWRETAKLLRPLEVIFPESFEQAVCLLLHGILVSVGRKGHAVPWAQLSFAGKDLSAAAYPDSYNLTRYDSVNTMRNAWQGSFAIVSVTTPDDWMNPAGTIAI